MAKKFLTNLDLQKNQLLQAVIENLAVAPEGAKLGQVYFDTLKSKFGVCVAIDEAGVRTWAYMSSAAELAAAIADLEGKINAKVAQSDYDAKVEELEGAIAAKVAQADYDAKMALLDAEDQKAAAHIADGDIHVTADQKAAWTAKQDALSEAQLAAANSGITADKVATYDAYAGQIATKVEQEAYNTDKVALEGAIATKVETETFNAKVEEINGAIADLDEATYSKDEVDAIVDGINTAIESSLPAQEGQAGKVLVTDGTDASWGYTTFIKEGKDGEKSGVSELVINKLSQKDYDELEAAGLINENELYITSDENKYYNTDEIDGKIEVLNEAINAKVAQADYDAKIAELEQADANLEANKVAVSVYNQYVEANNAAVASKVSQTAYDAKMALLDAKDEELAGDIADLNTALGGKADKANTLAGYGITDAYTKEETDVAIASAISSVYRFKGSVDTFEDLPTEGMVQGDVYNVKTKYEGENGFIIDAGDNVAWVAETETSPAHWDVLGGDVDLSSYATKDDVASTYETKADASATKTELLEEIARVEQAAGAGAANATHKMVATNEVLTPAGGKVVWEIAHTFGDDVEVTVKEVESGDEVVTDVNQTNGLVTITMNADETIEAETYKVVILG